MDRWAVVDTGPLVAYLDRGERHHSWTVAQFRSIEAPLVVCEPVLAETMFLLSRLQAAQEALFGLLETGTLQIGFRLSDHLTAVRTLCRKYRDKPMSLADACVVRMTEVLADPIVLTTDEDFRIYRRHSRQTVPSVMP